jgi:hypothetical protein
MLLPCTGFVHDLDTARYSLQSAGPYKADTAPMRMLFDKVMQPVCLDWLQASVWLFLLHAQGLCSTCYRACTVGRQPDTGKYSLQGMQDPTKEPDRHVEVVRHLHELRLCSCSCTGICVFLVHAQGLCSTCYRACTGLVRQPDTCKYSLQGLQGPAK